ncbi:MAG: diacylglycerol kinase family protein [Candidatus Sulfotelmatobacter sp.]
MRAAAIFGLGCSPHHLKPFQDGESLEGVESPENTWRIGMPSAFDQSDAILLFGGDGTIQRHLSQLVKLGLPVLIVPTGSGNDFARALGLRTVRDSLAAWRLYCAEKSNARAIDLGVITPLEAASAAPSAATTPTDPARDPVLATRYFCSVAGVGLDAEVARRANHLPRWLRGHGGYALALAPTMFQFAPFPMKILTPATEGCHPDRSFPFPQGMGSAVEGPAVLPHEPEVNWQIKKSQPTLLAAFANTPTYGGGMKIAPRAQMDDGLLDVCIIGSVNPLKLACMFPTVYYGRHLRIREVDYFSAAYLRLETEHPLDLYADGEYVCRTPVELSVHRAALRVIVPPSHARV